MTKKQSCTCPPEANLTGSARTGFYSFWLDIFRRHGWLTAAFFAILAGMGARFAGGADAWVYSLDSAAILFSFTAIRLKLWRSLSRLRLDINTLIVVAVVGALILGEWFEAVLAAFLYALSQAIESVSMHRAKQAIHHLLHMAPKQAQVVGEAGLEPLPVELVQVGQVVRVLPGERVPLDGEVQAGESYVDESAITGESVLQPRKSGDSVYAGSLNHDGSLDVEVTRPFPDSTLMQVTKMVEEAQANPAPIQGVVESFARYYTPLIFATALLIATVPPLLGGAWSEWFYRALVILVISCPCAFLISTPVTLLSALTSASRQGVLFKGGKYLEEIAKAKSVIFDKTGTLTVGMPQVKQVDTHNGFSRQALLRIAGSIEQHSNHPIAQAICAHALAEGAEQGPVEQFTSLPGRGAQATIEGLAYRLGNAALTGVHDTSGRYTTVGLSNDEGLLGSIRLQDQIRPDAHAAIQRLRELGVEHIAMLSGDHPDAARPIAAEIGIDEVYAGLLPQEKQRMVSQWSKEKGTTVMVGDGVNDAPALASAQTGVAMGAKGSDLALHSAPVALLTDHLERIPWMIEHGRHTRAVIAQNIAIALGIKFGFLAFAIAGSIHLWLAVLSDLGASLLVIANGLRMLRPKSPISIAGKF